MPETRQLPPDIEIARQATMRPIEEIARKLGVADQYLERYGKYKAKISLELCDELSDAPAGKLVLTSAITPTPAGEGKTTTSIGLSDALNRIGKQATVCIREPSLGPCFGIKGGAAGGGHAQVIPMEDINLHFTGDFHAIGLAHNLLAAAVDNHVHQGNLLELDPRRIVWNRVLDMNDRALRQVVVGLGGINNAMPRESSFDITVASEVMAIFCLSQSLKELKERLGKIIVGYTRRRKAITAADLGVHGAMTVLLKDALKPNLVQTLENNPAIIHGGPFANIAHGCNSVIATRLATRLNEYTVTEAGFGADLGAEKFFNIKCRKSGLRPDVVVMVATVRALKSHGGVALADMNEPNPRAVEKGLPNLKRHILNIHKFGVSVVVCLNSFLGDTAEEIALIKDKCAYLGVPIVESRHWEMGSAGAEELARVVVEQAENVKSDYRLLYGDELPLWEKARKVVREIYGGDDIIADKKLRNRFKKLQESYGHFPVCMAKTQYSFTTDPKIKGRPENFVVPLSDVRLSAGAEFLVVLTGEVMTMPGLPKKPAAESIDIDDNGRVVGLF
jgi:formate--tetrahydrofolate ligase